MNPMNDAIEFLMDRAKTVTGDVEVLAVQRKSTGIAFQQKKVDQFSFSETRQIGVRVIDGHHEGVAYSESLDPENLEATLQDAVQNSKMIEREWPSELRGQQNLPEMKSIYNPALENVSIEDKIKVASELESAALDFDPRITSVAYNRYSDASAEIWMANSRGLRASYKTNSCGGYAYCLAKDGDLGVMASEVNSQRDFKKISGEQIARTAAEKTLARLGARRPQTGRYTVVLENQTAEAMIGLLCGYFSAKEIDEKTSPLAGKLGQKVFSERLTLIDDPFHVQGAASRPFDDEGYAAQKTALVENGVIKTYLTNSSLAKKLKLPHTASASRSPSTDLDVGTSNVVVQTGTQSLEQLLSADGKVILITNALGMAGVRHTSGDFSIPVEGFLYENGKRSVALKDFLISGNLLQFFANVGAVGNDVLPPLSAILCPSLLIHDVNISGQA